MNRGEKAEGLASVARGKGIKVLRGPLHCDASGARPQVGDVELDELLHEIAAHEVLLIVAPLELLQEPPSRCPVCGRPCRGGECPACKARREEARRAEEERLLFDEGFSGLLCS
jgi:hypothetical protein